MTETFAKYLGQPVSTLLEAPPFNHWPIKRSIENDLPEQIIHYVFPKHGLELQSDRGDKISLVMLFADELKGFDESLLDVPFYFSRQQVRERFGLPSKSHEGFTDPILGIFGPWDRFSRSGYTIHFEFTVDADRIRKITLMRPDVVPK